MRFIEGDIESLLMYCYPKSQLEPKRSIFNILSFLDSCCHRSSSPFSTKLTARWRTLKWWWRGPSRTRSRRRSTGGAPRAKSGAAASRASQGARSIMAGVRRRAVPRRVKPCHELLWIMMSEASGGRQVHVCAVFLFLSLDLHSHCLQTANKTPLVVTRLNDFTQTLSVTIRLGAPSGHWILIGLIIKGTLAVACPLFRT